MLMVLGCTALLALTAPSTTLAQQVTVTADDLRVDMSVVDHLDRLKDRPGVTAATPASRSWLACVKHRTQEQRA
jgi:hypothetical protein